MTSNEVISEQRSRQEEVDLRRALRRYRLNIRKHDLLDRIAGIRSWVAWRFGAEYWCAATGGCGLKCTHPPKTSVGPYCPECHGRLHRVAEVTWADEVPWLRASR